ncbi:flagellin [Bradyrhizobium neotropicale]|uniref:flagellin N-terminal helical domain-containing protein n=1 Tax=Bradyrhizobium neotropicale TaxID=1497615 RepID=UPI001AD6E396|nr:flagellin [Bradyrhizobium neotropicale]MBO4227423.1 flagellar protein [Bradyrhizobium neotropicale]
MSGIILSASVRQNLLSLQSTADLLATTQSHLSTGKKVNSALDNPTNYFTAASLDNRASDINNLLDGIGNGVQVLQAANTGITSLQKLVDSAKSIANQALQATSGYSSKSTATSAAVTGATATNLLGNADTAATVSGTAVTNLAGTETTTAAGFTAGESFTVNGKTITFAAGGAAETAASKTDAAGNVTINLQYTAGNTDSTVADVLSAINGITGGTSSVSAGNVLTISNAAADKTNSITLGGSSTVLAKLGLTAGETKPTNTKDNQVLSIAAIGTKAAQTITIGTGAGAVNTLDDLNKKLADSNLTASISSDGKLSITTANDDASVDLTGKITGSATGASGLLGTLTTTAPVKDINAQNTRADLVRQYNTVIDQIKTTAQDASFNGINLLNGDQLKLVFNETGKSTLTINGVTNDPAGLGLASLTAGTDFIDNDSTQTVLTSLNNASSTLRSQASAFGSNLSIVQIRQDFSKNLINVLQTGSSNLTLADTNEEAANSQALSTRQSIAVSALALANQSQQSVLQLLR